MMQLILDMPHNYQTLFIPKHGDWSLFINGEYAGTWDNYNELVESAKLHLDCYPI